VSGGVSRQVRRPPLFVRMGDGAIPGSTPDAGGVARGSGFFQTVSTQRVCFSCEWCSMEDRTFFFFRRAGVAGGAGPGSFPPVFGVGGRSSSESATVLRPPCLCYDRLCCCVACVRSQSRERSFPPPGMHSWYPDERVFLSTLRVGLCQQRSLSPRLGGRRCSWVRYLWRSFGGSLLPPPLRALLGRGGGGFGGSRV